MIFDTRQSQRPLQGALTVAVGKLRLLGLSQYTQQVEETARCSQDVIWSSGRSDICLHIVDGCHVRERLDFSSQAARTPPTSG